MEQERLILDPDVSIPDLAVNDEPSVGSQSSVGIFDSVSQQRSIKQSPDATPGSIVHSERSIHSNQVYTKLNNDDDDFNNLASRRHLSSRNQESWNLPAVICCCHAGHVSLASLATVAFSSVFIAIWALLNNGVQLHPLLLTVSVLGLVTSTIAIVFGHIKQRPWSFLPFALYGAFYVIIRIVLLVLSCMNWGYFVTLAVFRDPMHSKVNDISFQDKEALEVIESDAGINRMVAQWCFYIETVLELCVLGLMIYAVLAYRQWVVSRISK